MCDGEPAGRRELLVGAYHPETAFHPQTRERAQTNDRNYNFAAVFSGFKPNTMYFEYSLKPTGKQRLETAKFDRGDLGQDLVAFTIATRFLEKTTAQTLAMTEWLEAILEAVKETNLVVELPGSKSSPALNLASEL